MGLFDVVANVATGGLYGVADGLIHGDVGGAATSLVSHGLAGTDGAIPAIEGAIKGDGSKEPSASSQASSQDDSDTIRAQSENNKNVAEAQIMTQEMALQQAGVDRELKSNADLELGLEKFDTHLQTSLLDFRHGMTVEQDQHLERMAGNAQKFQSLTSSSTSLDLAPPIDDGKTSHSV